MSRAVDLSAQVSVLIDPAQCEGLDAVAATVAGARLAERFDIDAARRAYLAAGDALNAAKLPSDWPSHMHLDARLHAYLAAEFHPARVCSGRERLGE